MAHPVVRVTKEQAAAAIAGLDPDKVPNVIVFLLRPSDEAGPAGEVEPIQGATLSRMVTDLAHAMDAFVRRAGLLGYTWPRGLK